MRLSSKEKQIVDYLSKQDDPQTPQQISKELSIKRSTVRGLLRRLMKRGLVYQPMPGHYAYLSPYGDTNVTGLRVHDLRMVGLEGSLRRGVKRPDTVLMVGPVKVSYTFGRENGKFSVMVGRDQGLDYGLLMAVLDRVEADETLFFGRNLVYTCSFHLHRDLSYIRLDGFTNVTIGEIRGCFNRIYLKDDVVRVEVGVSGARIDELVDLVHGDFHLMSFSFSIRRSVENVEKTVKEINSKVSQIQRDLNTFLDRSETRDA